LRENRNRDNEFDIDLMGVQTIRPQSDRIGRSSEKPSPFIVAP
jgi:hypothetical protein